MERDETRTERAVAELTTIIQKRSNEALSGTEKWLRILILQQGCV